MAIILLIIVIPLLAMSITLAARGGDEENPPTIFGYAPLVVASASMEGDAEGCFNEGDLVFIKVLEDEEKMELEVGDVVCYRTHSGGSVMFVTHRIVAVSGSGADTSFITKGDANDKNDDDPVTLDMVYGRYSGRIAGFGGFSEFVQTPWGIVCVVVIPILILVVIDLSITLYRRRKRPEDSDEETSRELEEKDEEIARLRAMLDEKEDSDGKGGKSDDET